MDTFDELTADIRSAVLGTIDSSRRQEALEWQIGHSRERDLAVIACLKEWYRTWYFSAPGHLGALEIDFQPVLKHLVSSKRLTVFDLLGFYVSMRREREWFILEESFHSVFFRKHSRAGNSNTILIERFANQPRKNQLDTLSSLRECSLYNHAVAICALGEEVDWGRLYRLTPKRSFHLDIWGGDDAVARDAEVRSRAEAWIALLDTLVEIEGYHPNTTMFLE